MAKMRTAREGRKGATYPAVHTGESESQPNQKLPTLKGHHPGRDQYDAYQGDRELDSDPVGVRKPTN